MFQKLSSKHQVYVASHELPSFNSMKLNYSVDCQILTQLLLVPLLFFFLLFFFFLFFFCEGVHHLPPFAFAPSHHLLMRHRELVLGKLDSGVQVQTLNPYAHTATVIAHMAAGGRPVRFLTSSAPTSCGRKEVAFRSPRHADHGENPSGLSLVWSNPTRHHFSVLDLLYPTVLAMQSFLLLSP